MAQRIISVFLVSLVSFIAVECVLNYNLSYNMPSGCRGRTYCGYKGSDYPSEHTIVNILKAHNLYQKTSDILHFSQRQGNPENNNECNGSHEYMRIYYIVDQYNVTRAVVQSNHTKIYYSQMYDITRCDKDGPTSSTKHIMRTELENLNIKLNCVTRYSYFDFHVLSSTVANKLESVTAELPVCCNCRYDKI